MPLYKYFKAASILPNPVGPLSARIPSSAIAEANKRVQPLFVETGSTSKKIGKMGEYLVYTDEEKLKKNEEKTWAGQVRLIPRPWAWPGGRDDFAKNRCAKVNLPVICEIYFPRKICPIR